MWKIKIVDFFKKYVIIFLKTKGKNMINELKRMIVENLSDSNDENLISENQELKTELENTRIICNSFKEETERLKNSLNTALDEIVQNQKRINALLNQLRDKNGGR